MKYTNWDNENEWSSWGSADLVTGMPVMDFNVEGRTKWVTLDGINSIEEAYEKYSPLAAVIISMAQMFANGKFEVLNRETQNYTRGKYKEWDNLLLNPNPLQSRTEFLMELYAYVLLNGWCYVLPIYPAAINDRPTAMYVLAPWMVEVKPANKSPYDLRKGESFREVYVTWQGKCKKYDEKDLILFKDAGAILRDKLTLLPVSRIKSLKVSISNGVASQESINTIMTESGAIGMISQDARDGVGQLPMLEEDKEDLQRQYRNNYGLTRSHGRKRNPIIVTDYPLKFTSMVQKVKDLMLIEANRESIMAVCDIYGFPHRLLSTSDGATYNNAKEDSTRVYNNIIVPSSVTFMETLNTGLKTAASNIEMIMSYDHVPALQQSEKEKGDGLKSMNDALKIEYDNNIITLNMWREKLGLDTVKDEISDLYKYQLTPEQRGIITEPTNTNDNEDGTEESDTNDK